GSTRAACATGRTASADRESHSMAFTMLIARNPKHEAINQSLAIARPHGPHTRRRSNWPSTRASAAASTIRPAAPPSPLHRERGIGHGTASITRHAWRNQKDWARGVSAKMAMRNMRNGLGPRMQELRSIGERDHTIHRLSVAKTPYTESARWLHGHRYGH